MRLRFGLRDLFLAVLVVAIGLWFVRPVARITSKSCSRIRPGMTVEQVERIIGARQGWYDGVGGIRDDAHFVKGSLNWIGMRGSIVVVLHDSEFVKTATFYPAQEILAWHLNDYLWERFTRVRYLGLSLPARLGVFSVITTCVVFIVGMVVVSASSANTEAHYGGIGLVVGLVIAVAVFADLFVSDLAATFLLLIGPIVGAAIGVLVAICRKVVIRRVASGASPTEACEGGI